MLWHVGFKSENLKERVHLGDLGADGRMWTRRDILPPSSGLEVEAVYSSETLVSTYKSTRRYNPEDQNRHAYEAYSYNYIVSILCTVSSLNVHIFCLVQKIILAVHFVSYLRFHLYTG
jgi:hypothetical protein